MSSDAESSPSIRLVVLNGSSKGQRRSIERLPFVVGRHNNTDWAVPDAQISGHHFALQLEEGELIVVDLNSRNHLFVNDEQVPRILLGDGDVIKAGNTLFRVELSDEPVELPPPEGPAEAPSVLAPPANGTPGRRVAATQLLPVLTDLPLPPEKWQLYHLAEDPNGEYNTLETAFGEMAEVELKPLRFSAVEDHILSNPRQALYGVVDAAQNIEFVFAAKQSGCDPVSLFLGERAWELVEVAPYFVRVPFGLPFLLQWSEMLGGHVGVLIDSAAPPGKVFVHLRNIFIVQDEVGREYFFRYYDPRVLNAFLPTRTPDQLQEVFGPIKSWILENKAGDGFVAYSIDDNGRLSMKELGTIEIENMSTAVIA